MRTFVMVSGWLWGLVALPEYTDAAAGFDWWFSLFFGAIAVALLWLGYSAAVPAVFRTPRVRWLWLSVPAIGVSCTLLGVTNHGLAARVWLCESTLRERAEWVRQNPKADSNPQRVGLFQVRYAGVDGERVYLTTASGFFDTAGIIYCPDGTPPDSSDFGKHRSYSYQHLYGPWWQWRYIAD